MKKSLLIIVSILCVILIFACIGSVFGFVFLILQNMAGL